jgi:hypothetical protein
MGYNGFGLQKWIYTQKPRKAFEQARTNTSAGMSEASVQHAREKVDAHFQRARQSRKVARVTLIIIGALLLVLLYLIII